MERKLREISGSLVITIPKQVCDLYNFKADDKISIEPIGVGELRLRKICKKAGLPEREALFCLFCEKKQEKNALRQDQKRI